MRITRSLPLLVSCLSIATAPAGESPGQAAATDKVGAEVVVGAERPGPGLWKVMKDGHVLWVLGTVSPLPKDMLWRSREVEHVLARAPELIEQESVGAHLGFFRTLCVLPSLLRARFNPDGASLREVLPADLYARWAALKHRYLDKDKNVERFRPMLAAAVLYERALKSSGLSESSAVLDTVRRLARRHGVKVTSPLIELEVADPRGAIHDFMETPREAEVACLAATLERIETDLDRMRERAQAWAVGDIDALERLRSPDQDTLCLEAFTSAPRLHAKFVELQDKARAAWMASVDSALSRNPETLAVLPISELLSPDGRLSQLVARGYTVETPR
jgi:uncharacterized protein YbaP (TraB family)